MRPAPCTGNPVHRGKPLTMLAMCLCRRSASSIYFPTVLVNGINGAFWSACALGFGLDSSQVQVRVSINEGSAYSGPPVSLKL